MIEINFFFTDILWFDDFNVVKQKTEIRKKILAIYLFLEEFRHNLFENKTAIYICMMMMMMMIKQLDLNEQQQQQKVNKQWKASKGNCTGFFLFIFVDYFFPVFFWQNDSEWIKTTTLDSVCRIKLVDDRKWLMIVHTHTFGEQTWKNGYTKNCNFMRFIWPNDDHNIVIGGHRCWCYK